MFKRRSKTDSANLIKKLEDIGSKKKAYESDGTEWRLTADADGNGTAVIRFLPAKDIDGEDVPFIKSYRHAVKMNGQWYIENCPTTIGGQCPVCEENSPLWNSGIESNIAIARSQKRKLSYTGNIVVLQDKANPDSVGKVFKYNFGQKIMEKIIAMGRPEFDGQVAIDVTDIYEGAPFYLKMEQIAGFPNYDKSTFGPVSELYDGDETQLKAIYDSMHPLKALIAPNQFKPYDELSKKWNKLSGKTAKHVKLAQHEDLNLVAQVDDSADIPFEMPKAAVVGSNDDDDLDDFFNSLD